MRKRYGEAAQRDGDRLGFPTGFRAQAAIDGETGDAISLAEAGDRLRRGQTLGFDPLDEQIDTLVRLGQMKTRAPAALQQAPEQDAQGSDQREQGRRQDPAFLDVDQLMARSLAKADADATTLGFGLKRGAAAAAWW